MLWSESHLAGLVGEETLENYAAAAYSLVNGLWPGGFEYEAITDEVHRIEWGQRCIEPRKVPIGAVTSLVDADGSAVSDVTTSEGLIWFPRVWGGAVPTHTDPVSGALDAEYTLSYKAGYSTTVPLETGATAPPDSLKMAVALLAQWLKNSKPGAVSESLFGNSVTWAQTAEWPQQVRLLIKAAMMEARR